MARAAKLVQQIPILMTRPRGSNEPFLDRLAPDLREMLHVVKSPLIAIEPLGRKVDIGPEDGAIFTSANGVSFAPSGAGRLAYCLGAHTSDKARQAGWDAIFAGKDAAELVEALRQIAPARSLHHFHGVHIRMDVAAALREAGLRVTATPVYDQLLQPLSTEAMQVLNGDEPVLVPLFSRRTAKHFAELAPSTESTMIIAMSEAVADPCFSAGFGSVRVAHAPTARSMVRCLENLLSETRPG